MNDVVGKGTLRWRREKRAVDTFSSVLWFQVFSGFCAV